MFFINTNYCSFFIYLQKQPTLSHSGIWHTERNHHHDEHMGSPSWSKTLGETAWIQAWTISQRWHSSKANCVHTFLLRYIYILILTRKAFLPVTLNLIQIFIVIRQWEAIWQFWLCNFCWISTKVQEELSWNFKGVKTMLFLIYFNCNFVKKYTGDQQQI